MPWTDKHEFMVSLQRAAAFAVAWNLVEGEAAHFDPSNKASTMRAALMKSTQSVLEKQVLAEFARAQQAFNLMGAADEDRQLRTDDASDVPNQVRPEDEQQVAVSSS